MNSKRPIGRALRAVAACFLLAQPMQAGSLAGNYLAANQANYANDYSAAALYYTRALAQDPDNPAIMQNALLANVGVGDVETATAIARRMEAAQPGSQLADLLLLAGDVKQGEYRKALGWFEGGGGFSPLLDGLVQGWLSLGVGQMSEATQFFDGMASTEAMKTFSDYHRALALSIVGDFEGAAELMAGKNGKPLRIGRGSLIAHIQILSQLERNDEALALAKEALNNSNDPQILSLIERLSKGETLEYNYITSVTDGVAEVFLTLATVLANEENDRFGLIYGRLAEHLRPDGVDASILVADILTSQGQHDLAVENFNKVPADNDAFFDAEIGRAQALIAAGRPDAGIEALKVLSKTHGNIPLVHSSLGDALRRQSRFEEAGKAYEEAIRLMGEPKANHWFLYYARGISLERTGRWDEAEADFRQALALSPDQPLVLNYLGYGLVEKRLKLDEAQKMIETAVAKRPDDGYITDSLGWVLYQFGKFEEAVAPMERAIELLPVDPIINDHLGDVYWKVGRKLEARFQWRRAMSFKPEEKDLARIRLKLEIGLDEVLKREAEQTGTD